MRIACVGDSITYGAFILHRKRDCYPAQLGRLLGDSFEVGNFGMIGHTLQTSGDYPYSNSKPYRESSSFAPDVVVIMLGTNDARAINWKGATPFQADYLSLVGHYRSLPNSPRVFVMTLPAVYPHGRHGKVSHGIRADAIDTINEVIRSISEQESIGLIDAHTATLGHAEAFRFDGVHPRTSGATLIAVAVHRALASESHELS